MIKLSARDAGKAWEKYIVVCDGNFGAPNHRIAALSTELETPKSQIPLAAKLLLAIAYSENEAEKVLPLASDWLKYIPRFLEDAHVVSELNTLWAKRSRGVPLSSDENNLLDDYLRRSEAEATCYSDDCTRFLAKVEKSISKNDRLIFHKACILLGVDYDEPNPPLLRMIWKTLFPSH